MAENEALDRQGMQALEKGKRASLLRHAARHVPYWRNTFSRLRMNPAEAEDDEAFRELPITTKATIRDHLEDLLSSDLAGNRLYRNSTSGSTGQPMLFYTDLRSKAYRKATTVRLRNWLGVRQGETVAHIWGSPIDEARALALRGRLHGLITRELFLSAYALTDRDMSRYSEVLGTRKPSIIVAYPSVMETFALFCQSHGRRFDGLKGIICSAETLYAHQRATIERAFGVPVFNRYGSREVGDLAQGRPGVDGLVVNSDRVFVEILGRDGRPCGVGETGDIVVTDLDNYGMPLIRYRIGDRGSWSSDTAGPFPVLAAVDGRSLDVVETRDGRRIGGTFWTIVLREKPGFLQFQVVQRSPDGVEIRFVGDPRAKPDFDWMIARIREHCGSAFEVRFKEVDCIPPGPGGKFRVVVSDMDSSDRAN
jgi:phenylacetate-CoA ligase